METHQFVDTQVVFEICQRGYIWVLFWSFCSAFISTRWAGYFGLHKMQNTYEVSSPAPPRVKPNSRFRFLVVGLVGCFFWGVLFLQMSGIHGYICTCRCPICRQRVSIHFLHVCMGIIRTRNVVICMDIGNLGLPAWCDIRNLQYGRLGASETHTKLPVGLLPFAALHPSLFSSDSWCSTSDQPCGMFQTYFNGIIF
jgi:hypothetical protein